MRNYVVCHYAKCYGPPVNYTTHIERKKASGEEHIPYNIKRSDLTKHNREFITEAKKIGRTAAIEKRLMDVKHQTDKDGNEYERAIRKDQVCCIEIRFSASPEAMAEIIEKGQLMDWCRQSIKWAQKEHGKENIVSAVLHMDEETPHLHVSLVPVVSGESKKQATTKKRAAKDKAKAAAEGGEVPKKKRRYKKKANASTLRLCADDVMTRGSLKRRQTEYAKAMETFGLTRGEEGSPARHKDLAQFWKEESERQHKRLDEVLAELADKEQLIEDMGEIIKDQNKRLDANSESLKNINQKLLEQGREVMENAKLLTDQKKTYQELSPLVAAQQEIFDTYAEANKYMSEESDMAKLYLENFAEKKHEILLIESEAMKRIKTASVSFMASKDVEKLSKENADLKMQLANKTTEVKEAKAAAARDKRAREDAESKLQRKGSTSDTAYLALERRHPNELRLLKELVSINIVDPGWQDRILSGETIAFKPIRNWVDPETGRSIPDEYRQRVEVKMEGEGNNSFISMCGKRIADFFRDIWAAVTRALGIKRQQEEEQRRQQMEKQRQQQQQQQQNTPKRGGGRKM